MPEKTISGWLIVDWKQGSHRTRKSKPDARELGNHELLAKLEVDVTIPEVEVPTLSFEIDVPEPQVHHAVIEALDEEQLPDWTDVVAEIVEQDRYASDIAAAEVGTVAFDDVVNAVTLETLTTLSSRPDPKQVRNYVHRLVRELAEPADGEEVTA